MAFATSDDVAIRLGRDLTAAEEAFADEVIADVQSLIAEMLGEDDDWADDLNPVPRVFKTICVEKAILVGSNPNGLTSRSETLGSFSESETFRRDAGGIMLTDDEERRVRLAYYGRSSGSSRPESTADEVHDLIYGS